MQEFLIILCLGSLLGAVAYMVLMAVPKIYDDKKDDKKDDK